MSEASKSPPRIENFNRSSRAGSPFIADRKKFLRPDSYWDGLNAKVVFFKKFVAIEHCFAKLILLLFCVVKKVTKKTTTHRKFQLVFSHRLALHP
jgi:hypothetical protein